MLTLLALLLCLQEPYDLKATLEITADGEFLIVGTTNAPEEARISVEINRGGDRIGPLFYSNFVRVKDGGFEIRTRPFKGPAPRGPYMISLRYDRKLQDRMSVMEQVNKSGRPPKSTCLIRQWNGTREEYKAEDRRRRKELAADILGMVRRTREVIALFNDISDEKLAKAFLERSQLLRNEILEVDKRNYNRPELRYYDLAGIANQNMESIRAKGWAIVRDLQRIVREKGLSDANRNQLLSGVQARIDAIHDRSAVLYDKLGIQPEGSEAALLAIVRLRKALEGLVMALRREEPIQGKTGLLSQMYDFKNDLEKELMNVAHRIPAGQFHRVLACSSAGREVASAIEKLSSIPNPNESQRQAAVEALSALDRRLSELAARIR